MGAERRAVTELLVRWRQGDEGALDDLVPLVYDELRSLAGRFLQGERREHSLQPTALVHEAYLRLVDKQHPRWQDRVHFFAVAAQLMRRVLVDHARARGAAKRGGDALRVSLNEAEVPNDERAADVVALDDALSSLKALDERKARIIELRYFAGLSLEETAEVLELSVATVGKEARLARAWLYRELERRDALESTPVSGVPGGPGGG